MDSFIDLIEAVQSDLTIGNESTLFSLDTVKLAINRAYRKAGGLFRWPELEDAKKTSTGANQEYYDYPDNFRPDSIWKLEVDGVDYGTPLAFKDYLFEKENNLPSGLDKMWSAQWRRFFIYPTPTSDGNLNISVWGLKAVDELVNDTDTTIYSYSEPEGNEAIVLEAISILRSKGDDTKTGQFMSAESKAMLGVIWSRIKQENAKYEQTTPFLDVVDMFGNGSNKNNIGKF